jgi:hypothetical protein
MTDKPIVKTSVQLHALPSELAAFALEVCESNDVHAICFMRTGEVRPFDRSTSEGLENDHANVKAIAFTVGEPVSGFGTIHQFHKLNPDALAIEFGQARPAGLEESWLWATATNAEPMALWKHVAAQLRKVTTSGAVAENVRTGATTSLRSHRLTPGAIRLDARGVPLLSVAPDVRVHPPGAK